jgi:hypothetical protein
VKSLHVCLERLEATLTVGSDKDIYLINLLDELASKITSSSIDASYIILVCVNPLIVLARSTNR